MKLKKIFHIILMFLLVFAPKLPVVYNGTYFVGLVMAFIVFAKVGNTHKTFSNLLSKEYTLACLFAPLIILFFSICIGIIHGTFDFTMLRTILNSTISFFCVLLFISFLLSAKKDVYYIHNILYLVFFFQTVIIVTAFIVPSFKEFIIIFQSDSMIKNQEIWGGIRTLVLGTTAFFVLGAAYGLICIFFIQDHINANKKIGFKSIVLFLSFIIGIFFIARTGFLGVVLSLFLFLLSKIKMKMKALFFIKAPIIISFTMLIIALMLPKNITANFEKAVLPFAFEMFYKKDEKMETSSTTHLKEMWKTDISFKTFLIGDGKYTDDGHYYKETDVGYLRNILFGGIGYLFLFLFFQIYLFLIPLLVKGKRITYTNLLFIGTLLSYFLLLHMKGEALFFSITLQIICFIYFLPLYYLKNENSTHNHRLRYWRS